MHNYMTVHFQIEYRTRWGQELVLCVNIPGGSRMELEMKCDGDCTWFVNYTFNEKKIRVGDISYQYMVRNNGIVERVEPGSPHTIPASKAKNIVLADRWKDAGVSDTDSRTVVIPHVHIGNGAQWRGAGMAVPVFSLRSDEDFGIGEFADLKLVADWAAASGMSIVQTLPVNDTILTKTWRDSYPYSANSSFALHPMYLRLKDVGTLSDRKFLARMEKLRKELNSLPEIDFEKVLKAKNEYIDRLFEEFSEKCFASAAYRRFFRENSKWLEPYALYCMLRDKNGTMDFNHWPESERHYTPALLDKYGASDKEARREILKHCFVQYHLHIQFQEIRKYMNDKGILLKGDIPIGVNRYSSDAWIFPELFNMDCQAGAPPDDFAIDGQRWGMPTYNWDAMKKGFYQWFIDRFRKMADYFNAYRIDHLLGFFRIWEIPLRYSSGLMGRFNPALSLTDDEIHSMGFAADPRAFSEAPFGLPETEVLFLEDTHKPGTWHPRINAFNTDVFKTLTQSDRDAFRRIHDDFYYNRNNGFWSSSAMDKLPVLINATDMIVCGEDLGMIPDCVPDVMNRLRIMSLEVQRMPKDINTNVSDPATYPYMSVCTTSTHDTSVLRSWIVREMPDNPVIGDRSASAWQCADIIASHLGSRSLFAIFPIQDWLALDGNLRADNPERERINVPANPDNYWRYRIHIGLEQLLNEDNFNSRLKAMISDYGR